METLRLCAFMKIEDTEKEKKPTPGSGAGVELGTVMGAAQGIALSWSTSPGVPRTRGAGLPLCALALLFPLPWSRSSSCLSHS